MYTSLASQLKSLFHKIKAKQSLFLFCLKSVGIPFLLIHAYFFFGLSLGHDSGHFYNPASGIATGRFVGEFFNQWFSNSVTMPFFIGLYEVMIFTLVAFLMVHLFNVQKKHMIFLVCLLVASQPALLSLNAYMHNAIAYSTGILFAVGAACLATRKHLFYNALSILLLALSIGSYQANFALVVSLFLVYGIQRLLDGEKLNRILLLGIKLAGITLLGMLLYTGLWNLILALNGMQKSSYLNMNSLGLHSIKTLIFEAFLSYREALQELYAFGYKSYTPHYINLLYLLSTAFGLGYSIYLLRKEKDFLSRTILLLLLILALPFGLFLTRSLSLGMTDTLLVKYSFIAAPLLLLLLLDKASPSTFSPTKALAFALGLGIFINSLYGGNLSATKRRNDYEVGLSLATQSLALLHSYPGYVPGKPVQIIAYPHTENYSPAFAWCKDVTGAHYNGAFTYMLPFLSFLERLSPNENFQLAEQDYIRHPQVLELDFFPAQNCITEINGNYIIRFQNW